MTRAISPARKAGRFRKKITPAQPCASVIPQVGQRDNRSSARCCGVLPFLLGRTTLGYRFGYRPAALANLRGKDAHASFAAPPTTILADCPARILAFSRFARLRHGLAPGRGDASSAVATPQWPHRVSGG